MIYSSQFDYDNATPPDNRDYRDELIFADFIEDVTLKLLTGRDQCGIDAEILLIDLDIHQGGYKLASEWVEARVTEQEYRKWLL